MMTPTVTVGADAGLQQVVDAVENGGVPVLAVVDRSGRVIGTIEPEALPALFDARGPRVAGTPRQRRRRDHLAAATARDLMTPVGPPGRPARP
ncbi:hypothetical protein AB0M46_50460 [Dactylosporangium sp. NPDC051485]|uniref:hypothetical protein n=1 Tax=Dactylosporangium sp. NPDC051485 TaxID=3154846 RepID=UPI0034339258